MGQNETRESERHKIKNKHWHILIIHSFIHSYHLYSALSRSILLISALWLWF